MANYQKIVQLVSERTGLRGDAATGRIAGNYAGYTVLLERIGSSSNYTIKASTKGANGLAMDPASAKQIAKGSPAVTAVRFQNYLWTVNVKPKASAEKAAEMICEALQYITEVMRSSGQINVCAKCGQSRPTEGILVGNGSSILCEDCYHSEQEAGLQRQIAQDAKSENVVGGIVGALLGSVLGVIVMVIFGQLGYVSAVSGVVMGVCALKGYELLGGKITKKGVIISVIMIVLMVWVGNRLDWAITLQKEVFTEDSVFTVFRYLDDGLAQLKEAGADVSGYVTNLLMQYLFSALGAASMIITAVRNAKNANTTSRI